MNESSTATTGSSPRNQRLAVFALLGATVVGVVVYLVLFAGGSSNSSANGPVPHASHPPAAAPSSLSPQAVPAAYTAPVGRNPFQPAVTPPVPPVTASPSASGSVSGSASSTPLPTLILIPSSTPTRTPGSSVTPSPTVTVTVTPSPTGLQTAGAPISLRVDAIDATAGTAGTVNVTVISGPNKTETKYLNQVPGQVFGTYFKLMSIVSSDPAAGPVTYGAYFQYGDQFVPLGQGETAQLG